MSSAAYTEALERALARVISDAERQMQALAARCDATVAAMQARVTDAETRILAAEAVVARRLAATEADIALRVTARLAEIEPVDVAETVRGLLPPPPEPFDPSPLIDRIAAVEAREMPAPFDPEPLRSEFYGSLASVRKEAADALAAIPEPQEPAPLPDIPGLVDEAVRAAVVELTVEIDGRKDAASAEVERMVGDAVARAAAALPPPAPGKDADPEEVRAMVAGAVEAAVAAIPVPSDGKDADMDQVRAWLDEAVAALPPPKDGESVDPDTVKTMVDEAVAAIPPVDLEPLREEIAAVKSAIPVLPEPADLSGFALRSELPVLPEQKDWTPEIEALREEIAGTRTELGEQVAKIAEHRGVFPIAKEWADAVHYEGAVVRHNGSLWQAVRDTGKAPGGDDWACLAAGGDKGDPGESMIARGTFDPAEEYRRLDVVAYDGGGWLARTDNPGAIPGPGWQSIATRGGRGRQGESIKGDPGPGIVAGEVSDQGLVTLTNGDGSEVEIDLYPVLVRR